MAHELGLVDGAGVVVEAAGDAQVGDDAAGDAPIRLLNQGHEFEQALIEERVAHAQGPHLVDEAGVQ